MNDYLSPDSLDPDEGSNNLDKQTIDTAEKRVETHKNSRLALSIAFLSLFFTALGITVGYKHWTRMHDKAKIALHEISVIQQQLDKTAEKTNLEALRNSFAQASNDAEQRLIGSLHELDQIREQTAYSAKTVTDQIAELTRQQQLRATPSNAISQSLLTEIRFLLESAKRRLSIEHDKTSALRLLKEADQLLIQAASPEWSSVRENLSKDIAELERFSLPDVEKLVAVVNQLGAEITPLSVIEKELPHGEEVSLFEVENVKSLPGKVKTYLNDSISIRKQAEPARYALNSSDKERTDLLINLRLESLRLMVMQRHNEAYHQQIKSLKHMLETYYSPTIAKPWQETLDKLYKENLTPSQPNISTALDHFLLAASAKKETDKP